MDNTHDNDNDVETIFTARSRHAFFTILYSLRASRQPQARWRDIPHEVATVAGHHLPPP